MVKTENFEKVEITSSEELRDWLKKNHKQDDALEANPPALKNFDNFNDSSKRFVLRWIKLAKQAKTRI